MTGLLAEWLAPILAAAAAIGGLLLWGQSKKREGRKQAEAETAAEAGKRVKENVDKRTKADDRVAGADDAERKRLRDKYTRGRK